VNCSPPICDATKALTTFRSLSQAASIWPVLGLHLDERKVGQLLGRIAVGRTGEAQDTDDLACEFGREGVDGASSGVAH
jgi:hypothetical protein